jgi:hypothetical protein
MLEFGKSKVVPVLNQAPRHEDVGGCGDTAPHILNYGTIIEVNGPSRSDRFTPREKVVRIR